MNRKGDPAKETTEVALVRDRRAGGVTSVSFICFSLLFSLIRGQIWATSGVLQPGGPQQGTGDVNTKC